MYARPSAPPCVREITYEDYLYDRVALMAGFKLFLRLGAELTTPDRLKATEDSWCVVVENLDQLCDWFCGLLLLHHLLYDIWSKCFCRLAFGSPSATFREA